MQEETKIKEEEEILIKTNKGIIFNDKINKSYRVSATCLKSLFCAFIFKLIEINECSS